MRMIPHFHCSDKVWEIMLDIAENIRICFLGIFSPLISAHLRTVRPSYSLKNVFETFVVVENNAMFSRPHPLHLQTRYFSVFHI